MADDMLWCPKNTFGHRYRPTGSNGISACVHCGKKQQYDDETKTWKDPK